jgi:hypothetical protein
MKPSDLAGFNAFALGPCSSRAKGKKVEAGFISGLSPDARTAAYRRSSPMTVAQRNLPQ